MKYFLVDIQVRGRLIHDVGILVKADNIALTDSKGKATWASAILGCNLIWKGIKEFIRDHGHTCLELFMCPNRLDPLYFNTECVYFYTECQKNHQTSKGTSQKGCQHKLNGVGHSPQDSCPSKNINKSTKPNQPKPDTTDSSKKTPKSRNW